MEEAQGTPRINIQLISIRKIIITNARIFSDYVETWNEKAAANDTWPNLKTHFINAQTNYNRVPPTNATESYGCTNQTNQENAFEQVLQAINTHKSQEESLLA